MPTKKLKAFLDENNVRYVSIKHSSAYTAQEIASSAHVSGKELAKTVMIKIDGQMAMAVLPASYLVDLNSISKALETNKVLLASESEFKDRFPDCEVGAMPPFGNLYHMEVFLAESLLNNVDLIFNAGSHKELIKMSLKEYDRLVDPKILRFSYKAVSFPGDPTERWADVY